MLLVELGAADVAAGAVHLLGHVAGVAAEVDHLLGGDDALGVQAPQVVVQELHAELLAGLDGRVDAE
ncbi:MAG: hypothetical protein ACK55I_46715, partial [bacterium]